MAGEDVGGRRADHRMVGDPRPDAARAVRRAIDIGSVDGSTDRRVQGGGWISRDAARMVDHEERGGWVSPNQPTSSPAELPKPPAGPGGVAKKRASD
ncbi:hypothetical protein GCM10022267_03890 [Lentzea roselyniae]|uniref:Uncharacterized protein n=1 Tax=Lentzea roselyniae TaxID=531940 RepID=A0ABP7A0Y4_9PSEU